MKSKRQGLSFCSTTDGQKPTLHRQYAKEEEAKSAKEKATKVKSRICSSFVSFFLRRTLPTRTRRPRRRQTWKKPLTRAALTTTCRPGFPDPTPVRSSIVEVLPASTAAVKKKGQDETVDLKKLEEEKAKKIQWQLLPVVSGVFGWGLTIAEAR